MAVGTTRSMWFEVDNGHATPEEGDFLLHPVTGTTYLIERCRQSPSVAHRFNLVVTRLDQWAVEVGDEGVHLMEWRRA